MKSFLKTMQNRSAKEAAFYIAEKKAQRERREICVHRNPMGDLKRDVFYVTPKKKVGDNVKKYKHVRTFEPEGNEGEYEQVRIRDHSKLETGTRVLLNSDDVQIVTDVTSRQIVTNVGNKFRKSDGVEWGGGDKEITYKLIKNKS
jgi:hypothetical protein